MMTPSFRSAAGYSKLQPFVRQFILIRTFMVGESWVSATIINYGTCFYSLDQLKVFLFSLFDTHKH